ncbi:hypothetical protein EVJ58_g2519 [Rhodofomes roseus]|uniref:Uncharacterized protein n=1 Tax=Rhodofomes roseus TaxID=34475 RepID=A0A4Y9YU44_9APHY|nr:hypothetical protein EVJ58_g2519 [Rhodofomes roseus]
MARAHHGMSTPSPTSAGAMAGQMSMAPSPIPGAVPMGRAPRRSSSDEIRQLHQRIAELEADRDTALQRAHQLEQELARRIGGFGSSFASGSGALPSPVPTPTRAALPMALEENWRARTEARRQIFCSVNRAGNALCAWHDSRRERRAYPPRNAPPGVLNCGCTYEEALFEESLSRHGVGSYHPGEPATVTATATSTSTPVTQTWRDGEDAAHWKQKLASGAANARRNRGEDRR